MKPIFSPGLFILCIGYLQFYELGMPVKSPCIQMKFEAKKSVREQGVESLALVNIHLCLLEQGLMDSRICLCDSSGRGLKHPS